MPNKLLVRNAYLNEFVYDLLYNITQEEKKNLSKPFLHILKSSVKCKNFAEFSTLDEKVRFFSELGKECVMLFLNDPVNSVNGLKKVLEKYEDGKQVGASKELVKLKVFVSSDKHVKFFSGLMADTIMHKSYFLNLELNKTAFHIKSWPKLINTPDSEELKDSIDSADVVTKNILSSLISIRLINSLVGIDELSMMILLYLYGYRHTYIEKERIWSYFVGGITKGKITTSIKRLFLNQYIRKHVDYKHPKFTITSSGLLLVNQFRERVIKQNGF